MDVVLEIEQRWFRIWTWVVIVALLLAVYGWPLPFVFACAPMVGTYPFIRLCRAIAAVLRSRGSRSGQIE